jgi:serine/threonine protein kinase
VKSGIVAGIVIGMKYIHSKGIIHRDLKPNNILLENPNHTVRICDFNISRQVESDTTFTRLRGTPRYMAPEIFEFADDNDNDDNDGADDVHHDITEKIDVYAFGLIFYEILFGRRVFPEDFSDKQIMYRVIRGKLPDIPGEIPFFVGNLIGRCWSREPDDRPTFSDILSVLRVNEFKLSDECDCSSISSYVSSIEEQEAASV